MSLGLAAPLWLLGLLALAAPLVLHLLARGRGRRVRVGSVRLLTDSPPRRPRRLQLQRPLLLAWRCLLLALVALALAGPRLRREAAAATAPPPWVLVEPGVDARAVEAARRALDGGAELRLLATGLPRAAAVADAAALPDVAAVPGGLWSLLREAAASAPAGTRLLVVTSGRLAALRGERPALANAVEWHEVSDARPNRWVAGERSSEAGSELLVGDSDRSRTTFRIEPAAAGGNVDVVRDDDRVPNPSARRVRVSVFAAADRQADARYVRAALAAATEAAGVAVDLAPVTAMARTAAATSAVVDARAARSHTSAAEPASLIFWLADAAPPPPLLTAVRAGGTLITDSGAPEESCEGTFVATSSLVPVTLRRCGAAVDRPADGAANAAATSPQGSRATGAAAAAQQPESPAHGSARRASWRSDAGRVVLAEQTIGGGRWLRFGSRFHPAWSDLVLSPAFPEWLRDVLRAAAGGDASSELPSSDRRADGGQGRPAETRARGNDARSAAPGKLAATPSQAPASPLPERAAWLLLFPLLLAERWLATRR